MFDPPPAPPPEPHPPVYEPSEADAAGMEARPGAVTAVVVISYLQAGLALVVAFGFLILSLTADGGRSRGLVLVVEAVLFAVIGILLAVMGNRLGKRSRGWRTAYLVLTAIGVVLGLADVVQNPSSLGGTIIGIVCIVLLLQPRSRAWFAYRP